MSGVEDISDDNNEEQTEKVVLFEEHQWGDRQNEPIADGQEVEAGNVPLTANTEVTAEDVEHCRMDDGVGSSKADNTDDALKVIAMCKLTELNVIYSIKLIVHTLTFVF